MRTESAYRRGGDEGKAQTAELSGKAGTARKAGPSGKAGTARTAGFGQAGRGIRWAREYVPWLLGAAVFTLMAGAGVFYRQDALLGDFFYQNRKAADARIVVVGIDERALKELGPFSSWNRGIMAQVLEYLNQSEQTRPAVIGLDVLYAGETVTSQDEWLARAACEGNVVTASAASFGKSVHFDEDGGASVDDFTLMSFEEPYDSLRDAAAHGHINAMYDKDGILRRGLLSVRLPDGREVLSFAQTVASLYRNWEGKEAPALPPVDSQGFWYLDFTGMPGDYYESISVADLLDGSIPPDYFAGRIVLIGPYAAGLQDQYTTAIDHALPMYGVEIQANAIQAVLEENYRREAGAGVQLALLAGIMVLAALWFRRASLRSSTLLWLLLCSGYVLAAKAAYRSGLVLHILWVPLGVTALYGGAMASCYLKNILERRRVTSTFKRYVAPEIVDEILKQGTERLELGGKMSRIAVLFVDIRGFTSMSEMLTPVQVVEVLNLYLSLTSSCIMKNGGTLDKFIGDAAMAFWGAPLPRDDYVMDAVRAALDMREGAKQLQKELETRFGRWVTFGIGIHVGQAVVGNIGASSRMDYTAIGDTVNTASRLEAAAPGGKIYISGAVAEALEGRIQASPLGNLRFKGKSEEMEVWDLEGAAAMEMSVPAGKTSEKEGDR